MNYERLQSVYSKNGYPIIPVKTGMFIEVHEKVGEEVIKNEIDILRICQHPYVVGLYDVIETYNTIDIVLEYCKGGELYDKIREEAPFPEDVAANIMYQIFSAVNSEIFGVWFLIGAALVFWMQAGFAMVEAGFTRAKNTGNIIMKNLMDFCIGTVMFVLLGYSLLCGSLLVLHLCFPIQILLQVK